MHIAFAQRVLADPTLGGIADLLRAQWGAFLLGNIAPDARVSSGLRRADTHFFEYEPVIATPAIDVLLTLHPTVVRTAVRDDAQAAFLAGYVAHLALDEVWCTDILFPYFTKLWDGNFTSFQMLHIILGWLDARDRETLWETDYPALVSAQPTNWLPFIPDSAIAQWRDLVAAQIAPGGESKTLEILSQRIKMNEADMREFVQSERLMNDYLWRNVPPAAVEQAEAAMYARGLHNILTWFAT